MIRRCCCDGFSENRDAQTVIYGRPGPTGPTGPTGPIGPTGTLISDSATIYNGNEQTATNGTPLTLPTILTDNELTIGNDSITVLDTATYLVSYSVNKITGGNGNEYVSLKTNGNEIQATRLLLSSTAGVSGSYVLNLNADDEITIVPSTTGNVQIVATPGPSVTLSVARIS